MIVEKTLSQKLSNDSLDSIPKPEIELLADIYIGFKIIDNKKGRTCKNSLFVYDQILE